MLLKHPDRVLYDGNWKFKELSWEESRLHYRFTKLLTWPYIYVLLSIRRKTWYWLSCSQHMLPIKGLVSLFSHRWVGQGLTPCHGPQPVLSWVLGLTWLDCSVFCSSHGFAKFSPNILRLFAFPQATTVTSVLLPCTSYHSLLVVLSIRTQYKTQHLVPCPPCDPKDLVLSVIGFPSFSKLWFLSAHQASKTLSQGNASWLPDHKVRTSMARWTSQLSTFLLSSRILDPCSHLPGKSCFYLSCGFWWWGLSSLEIGDSFLCSCFLNPLWKVLSSSTASGQGTKRTLLNMQTLQPAFQLLLLQKALFNT